MGVRLLWQWLVYCPVLALLLMIMALVLVLKRPHVLCVLVLGSLVVASF